MFEGPAVEMFVNVSIAGFYATSLYQYYCYAPFPCNRPSHLAGLCAAPGTATGSWCATAIQATGCNLPEISDIYYPYSVGLEGSMSYLVGAA